MRAVVQSDVFSASQYRDVPYLKTSVIHNADSRELIVYAVNRSLEESMELDVVLEGFENCVLKEHIQLYSDDLKASNDRDRERVAPVSVPVGDKIILKNHSWNMLRYEY